MMGVGIKVIVKLIFIILYMLFIYLPTSESTINIRDNSLKLLSHGFAGDGFGYTVDISRSFMLIGCPNDNINGKRDSGSAIIYAFNASTFDHGYKIAPYDENIELYFGRAVAIDNKRIVIGSRYDNHTGKPAGSAYIYKLEGEAWALESKLIASDGATHDGFGYDVDIYNNYAVVSSFKDDDTAWNAGSVYVFKYDGHNWTQHDKITSNDSEAWDFFGYAVGIDNETIAIGAISHDSNNVKNSGAVYIFTDNGNASWELQRKLEPSTPFIHGYFGGSIDINRNRLVVGAYGEDTETGSVYVYKRNENRWIEDGKLIASDKTVGNHFGWSVAINGSNIVVGSRDSDDKGLDSGAAYVFQYMNGEWREVMKLLAYDGDKENWFGRSVSIQNSRVIVGSYSDKRSDNGSVYMFDITSEEIVTTTFVTLVLAIVIPLGITLLAIFFIFKFRFKLSRLCSKKKSHKSSDDKIASEQTMLTSMTVRM